MVLAPGAVTVQDRLDIRLARIGMEEAPCRYPIMPRQWIAEDSLPLKICTFNLGVLVMLIRGRAMMGVARSLPSSLSPAALHLQR